VQAAADDDPGSGEIPTTVLGLDIGGSSSRARLRSGQEVRDVSGPGANVATLDAGVVGDRLAALLGELGDVTPAACCAGAAGAEVPAARERLRALLERSYRGSRVIVVHDARLVLAAAGVDEGIALVAGTGSVAYARTADGREARRGGWGWMVGDEGSGVWVAREATRLVMARTDDGLDVGPLGVALLEAAGADEPRQLIAALHAIHEPMGWAALAEVVFATSPSDPGAHDIIRRAATELVRLFAPLRALVDGPLVLAGGLLLHHEELESEVRRQAGTRCVRLELPPVEGAVRLAEGLLVGKGGS
jgi:glucosamine kinase